MVSILDVIPKTNYLPIKQVSNGYTNSIYFYVMRGQEGVQPINPEAPSEKQKFDLRIHCLNDNNEYLFTLRQGSPSYNHMFSLAQISIKNGFVIEMKAKKIGSGNGTRNDYMGSKIARDVDYDIDAHEKRIAKILTGESLDIAQNINSIAKVIKEERNTWGN
jgi:hypothetical protein